MSILSTTKLILNIDSSDTTLDTILENYIALAKEYFTVKTNWYLGSTKTDTYTLYPNEEYGYEEIYLPFNFNNITSIVIDDDILDTSYYIVDNENYKIIFIDSDGHKTKQTVNYYIKITYTIGYTSDDNIPSNIQLILANLAAYLYNVLKKENYVTTEQITINPIPPELEALIMNYCLVETNV